MSVKFSRTDCRLCSARCLCTKAAEAPRHLTLRPQADHQMLQRIREVQNTPEWKRRYERRAGIEGTISQGTRAFGLRSSRYIGLARTHLQHIFVWITDFMTCFSAPHRHQASKLLWKGANSKNKIQ